MTGERLPAELEASTIVVIQQARDRDLLFVAVRDAATLAGKQVQDVCLRLIGKPPPPDSDSFLMDVLISLALGPAVAPLIRRTCTKAVPFAVPKRQLSAAVNTYGLNAARGLTEATTLADRLLGRNELRKRAIKAMRLETFAFDGIVGEADGAQEVGPTNGDLVATVARFFEEAFEWTQVSHFLCPYYWPRRSSWPMRMPQQAVDARHAAFLRAGAPRYVVPVTPRYENQVIDHLEGEGGEVNRLGPPPGDYESTDPVFKGLRLQLPLDRRPELALGSGTLSLTSKSDTVTINPDSNWLATERDRGTELYIVGDIYAIVDLVPFVEGNEQQLTLDEAYPGPQQRARKLRHAQRPVRPEVGSSRSLVARHLERRTPQTREDRALSRMAIELRCG